MCDEEEDENKVFMFTGFNLDKAKEKEDLIDKITKLGGEVNNSLNWDDNCTHIIGNNFALYPGKVLAGLACGKWIVTRRFIDRSFKNGTWAKSKPFICDQAVLDHRDYFLRHGGRFRNMKIMFLMENCKKRDAYIAVAKAGGATVLENWGIDELIKYKPGPFELTHIVADPVIHSERDIRYVKFKEWQDYAKQVWDPESGETLHYIYYKYFFDCLSNPRLEVTPENYSIFSPKVLQIARENGDLKICEKAPAPPDQTETAAKKRESDNADGASKKLKTDFRTKLLAPTLVNLDESDDDDILILEQRLLSEGGERRIYYDTSAVNPSTEQSSSNVTGEVTDHEERRESTDEEDSATELNPDDKADKTDSESEIEVLETVAARLNQPVLSKKSKMFTQKLLEMQEKEQKREKREERKREKERLKLERRAARLSTDSRESRSSGQEVAVEVARTVAAEEITVPTLRMSKLSLDEPGDEKTELLNRIVATVLERQLGSDECIEISNAAARTARYDKNRESVNSKMKLKPVGSHVKEEFYNRFIEKQELFDRGSAYGDDEETINFTPEDEANNHLAHIEILEYLRGFTNLNTHPTSSIINTIMMDFIMKQTSRNVAFYSCQYLEQFIFLYMGREKTQRDEWLHLILSSMRDNQSFNQFDEFSLENNLDIQACWRFFSLVLAKDSVSADSSSSNMMLRLLVNICQKDFEIWWKHYRRTENKDNRELSFPMLYYLLDGKRNLLDNISRSVLTLYSNLLDKDKDITDVRKLLSMTGMLVAHLDSREKNVLLTNPKSLKMKLASKLQKIFTKSSLSSDELYMELNLLKPAWLAWTVAKIYLQKEKGIEMKGVGSVVEKLSDLTTSCDTDMFVCLDTFLVKWAATTNLHTVMRTHWSLQSEERVDGLAFAGMDKLEKKGHRSKVIKLKSDVSVLKDQVVQDINSLAQFHNQDRSIEDSSGDLKKFFFKMSGADKF